MSATPAWIETAVQEIALMVAERRNQSANFDSKEAEKIVSKGVRSELIDVIKDCRECADAATSGERRAWLAVAAKLKKICE